MVNIIILFVDLSKEILLVYSWIENIFILINRLSKMPGGIKNISTDMVALCPCEFIRKYTITNKHYVYKKDVVCIPQNSVKF